MLKSDQALLAYRILETAATNGETWFDEVLNGSGVPKVLGILFAPEFRPITLQLILVAILFGWLGARRFGLARFSTHSRRRSIVEHAEAVGMLYDRANAGQRAVKSMHEFFKQELRRLFGQSFRVGNVQAVARQAQVDEDEVRDLFRTVKVARSDRTSSIRAARILKRLSKLVSAIRSDQ